MISTSKLPLAHSSFYFELHNLPSALPPDAKAKGTRSQLDRLMGLGDRESCLVSRAAISQRPSFCKCAIRMCSSFGLLTITSYMYSLVLFVRKSISLVPRHILALLYFLATLISIYTGFRFYSEVLSVK